MRLYIETSVVGFWFDRLRRNRDKRRSTRRFLVLCRRGVHEGFVSKLVVDEIKDSPEPFRSRDLALITRLALPMLVFDRAVSASLFEGYRQVPILNCLPDADLQHLAFFGASDAEGLVTWNLHDLTNQVNLEAVRKVNHAQGISKELRVAPPEAFIPPRPV